MSDVCTVTAESAPAQFSTQLNLLYGKLGKVLALKNPWINILEKGTFEAQNGQTLVAPVQARLAPTDSQVFPTFRNQSDVCDSCGDELENGASHYNYVARIKHVRSQKICYNQTYNAFRDTLISHFNALTVHVNEVINNDTRAELFSRSGVKAIVKAGVSAEASVAGSYNAIDTALPATVSDARLTYQLLRKYVIYARDRLLFATFGDGNGAHLILMAGTEILDALRADLGAAGAAVISNYAALTAAGDSENAKGIKSYVFEQLFQGVKFAQDPRPMRWSHTGAAYVPVEPEVKANLTVGAGAVPNPAYDASEFESAMLLGYGSFRRDVLASWAGEGSLKWARMQFGGEIKFFIPQDTQNISQNMGIMFSQIGRAFRPQYPWFVLPILFKRCYSDSTATACYAANAL